MLSTLEKLSREDVQQRSTNNARKKTWDQNPKNHWQLRYERENRKTELESKSLADAKLASPSKSSKSSKSYNALTAENLEMRIKLQQCNEDRKQMAEDLTTEKRTIEQLNAELESIREKISLADIKVANLSKSNNSLTAENLELRNKLQQCDVARKRMAGDLKTEKRKIEQLNVELESKSNEALVAKIDSTGTKSVNKRKPTCIANRCFEEKKSNLEKTCTSKNLETFKLIPSQFPGLDESKSLRNQPQYRKIKVNHPFSAAKFDADIQTECECSPTNPCGPASECLNFISSVECKANCPAEDQCQNQRFSKRIYPKLQKKHFESKGWGLVAREDIARHTFIIEYVGEIIDRKELTKRFNSVKEKTDNLYFLLIEKELYIDATVMGNNARFINHSCEPNCILEKWVVNGQTRVGLFANQYIPMV